MTLDFNATSINDRVNGTLSTVNYGEHLECVYCQTLLNANYLPQNPWDYVIESGTNYVIVPSKGALLPGWLLVVGTKHHLSRASMALHEFADFEVGIQQACAIVQPKFGPATVFESGPSYKGTSIGCGIDHVHVHVLPLQFSLADATRRIFTDINWVIWNEFRQLQDLHTLGEPYYFIKEPDREPLYTVPTVRSSQLLRKVIAAETGQTDLWDYSQYCGRSNARKTLKTVLQSKL